LRLTAGDLDRKSERQARGKQNEATHKEHPFLITGREQTEHCD